MRTPFTEHRTSVRKTMPSSTTKRSPKKNIEQNKTSNNEKNHSCIQSISVILRGNLTLNKKDLPFSGLSRPLAGPPKPGRLEIGGFGWAWARMSRRTCTDPGHARARAQRRQPHFLFNIRAQAHPNPSVSSLPATGGRDCGRPKPKKKKRMRKLI